MALAPGIWAIDGGDLSGNLMRLFFRSATRNNEGVVEIGDLLVKAQDTPAGSVIVGDGAAIIRGKEVLWQGSYWNYNIGDATVNISPTSGTARKDLLWLRMEDPTFEGSGWSHDPAVDVCASFVVTQNVSANTETIPDGFSGIPLARIEIPAGTTNITSEMIKDVRKMADPRNETLQFSLQGSWDEPDSVGNTLDDDWEQWPNGASWDIDIPQWASQAVISFTVGGVQYRPTGGAPSGTADAQGKIRTSLGTKTTVPTRYWVRDGIADYSRFSYTGGDTINLPVSLRGTTQTLQLEGVGTTGCKGKLEADGGSGVVVAITFREIPVNDEPDRSPQ